jgi:DNA-binding NarL/FixJ family response regulator
MRIIFASKKRLLVEALSRLLGDERVGQYTIVETLDSLEKWDHPGELEESDLIILTEPGFDCSTVCALRQLHSLCGRTPVVLISCGREIRSAAYLFQHGVRAVLTKDCEVEDLYRAIKNASKGKPYLTPATVEALAADLYENNQGEAKLSEREIEVMGYIARGSRTSEIAKHLRLSAKTVSAHKSSIKVRLNLRSTSQIVQYAIEHGIADFPTRSR